MNPIETLKQEHRIIEQVLSCVEAMADGLGKDGKLDRDAALDAVDFLRQFADRCHHGKEETHLFAELERRGFSPEAGPTAAMRSEHEQSRGLIEAMHGAIEGAAGGQSDAVATFRDAAGDYVDLLRQHIQKEDHCLFPMAEQALDPAAHAELEKVFVLVEREELGPDFHETYLKRADALADRFGVARAFQGADSPSG